MYGSIFNPGPVQGYGSPQNFGAYGVDPGQAGWDLNAAYLTPSNMAGYRPAYAGDQNFPMPYMGFGRGLMTAAPSPFQPETPFYINPLQYREQGIASAQNAAMDATVTAMQFIGSTAVGLAVSSALTAKSLSMPVNPTWSGLRRAVGASRYGSMFEAMGGGLGEALGGVGGGLTGGVLSKATKMGSFGGGYAAGAWAGAGIGGTVGAAAGWAFGNIALPMIIADAVDKTVFASYTGIRRGQDAIREGFRGMAGMGTMSSPLTPSSDFTRQTGYQLTKAFSEDLGFKPGAGADIFQFGQSYGLYRGGSIDPTSIKRKTREIADQLKMVMDVFNEPSMQDAIGTIAKLQFVGGAGAGGMRTLGSAYRVAGALTGDSTQRLMNTIGQQGQLMYGQSGVLPYLGQLASLSAYQGISHAYRNGLVSNQALAMMGGLEGSTQSMVQVQSAMAQSPYNRMTAMLQEFYGGGRGGINQTLGEYGQRVASNPIITAGQMAMYGDRAVSAQLSKNPFAMFDQIVKEMKMIPGATDANGKVRFEAIAAAMHARGFDSNAINSVAAQFRAAQDPGFLGSQAVASKASQTEMMASILERSGLQYGGPMHLEYYMKASAAAIQSTAADVWDAGMQGLSYPVNLVKSIFAPNTLEVQGRAIEGTANELAFAGRSAMEGFSAAKAYYGGGVGGTIMGALNFGSQLVGGIAETDRDGRALYQNLSDKLKADPKKEKLAKELMAKAKAGTLTRNDKSRLVTLTGAKNWGEAQERLGQMYAWRRSTSEVDISSKNLSYSQVANMAKKDLMSIMTSGLEGKELYDTQKIVSGMSAAEVDALAEVSNMSRSAASEDELRAALEKNPEAAAALMKVMGTTSLDETDVLGGASKANLMVSMGQAGTTLASANGEDIGTALRNTRGQNNYKFSDKFLNLSYDDTRAAASGAISLAELAGAAESMANTSGATAMPASGEGDFQMLNSASLQLGRAADSLLEASNILRGSQNYGYRTQNAN